MIVNLGTPQYTVQDLTLYRNEQGLTAPPPLSKGLDLPLRYLLALSKV